MELIIAALIYFGVIATPDQYQAGMENTYSDKIEQYQDESYKTNDQDTETVNWDILEGDM